MFCRSPKSCTVPATSWSAWSSRARTSSMSSSPSSSTSSSSSTSTPSRSANSSSSALEQLHSASKTPSTKLWNASTSVQLKNPNTRFVIFTFSAFITFLSNAQNAHLSMFASWMAQLGFFLPPMMRPGIKLTSVQLHLFLRDLNQGHLTYWATPATARLSLLELSLQNCY